MQTCVHACSLRWILHVRVQTCRKQYKTAMEMETHLSSYDHHHTKVITRRRLQ